MNKKLLATTIAVLMSASALPALAQDATVSTDVGSGVTAQTPAGDAAAQTGTSVDANAATSPTGTKASGSAASGTKANATTGGTTIDANAAANTTATTGTDAAADDNSFAAATAAVSASGTVDLSDVTEDTNISIVLLSSLVGDVDTEGAALESAINAATAGGLVKMHADVGGNVAIMEQLEAEGFTADDVVAIKTTGEDSVIVYVDDRA